MAINQVCHIEFKVTDMARAQQFYSAVFGWDFRSFGEDMVVFGKGAEHIGGLQKSETVAPGDSPSVWFETDSIENYLATAARAGGSTVSAKSPVPGVGYSAVVGDPDGNPVGLVQFEN